MRIITTTTVIDDDVMPACPNRAIWIMNSLIVLIASVVFGGLWSVLPIIRFDMVTMAFMVFTAVGAVGMAICLTTILWALVGR